MNKIHPRMKFKDNFMTFDAETIVSAGAFLVGELERLDQDLHEPLVSVTWSRDIKLRSDVSIADEYSSFTNSSFASAGGVAGSGKSWIGKDGNAIQGVGLGIEKTTTPLTLWAMQLGWTLPELESAIKLGRPIDTQKYAGLKLKHQMDIDEMVYVGDDALGLDGLLNAAVVKNRGKAESGGWMQAADVGSILNDVNLLLESTWKAGGYQICPDKLLLPPVQFSFLTSQIVSAAGNISILEYIKKNSLCNSVNGRELDIQPVKWLTDAGEKKTTRMVAYTNDENRLRFPMTSLQHTPVEYRDIRQLTTYFGRLGAVEFVYPNTVGYRDGI